MRIQTIGNFKSVVNKIEQKDSKFSDFLLETASLLNGKIQLRVKNKGLGAKDNKLPSYKKRYSDRRQKFGRQARYRDLTYTGSMWQSLTAVPVGNKRVEMFFGDAEDKAKAFYNDERTPFFSLSPSEKDFLRKELEGFAKL